MYMKNKVKLCVKILREKQVPGYSQQNLFHKKVKKFSPFAEIIIRGIRGTQGACSGLL